MGSPPPRGPAMPFQLAQAALMGVFLFVWLFIASMMLGDRLTQIRQSRTPALPPRGPTKGQPHFRARGARREEVAV